MAYIFHNAGIDPRRGFITLFCASEGTKNTPTILVGVRRIFRISRAIHRNCYKTPTAFRGSWRDYYDENRVSVLLIAFAHLPAAAVCPARLYEYQSGKCIRLCPGFVFEMRSGEPITTSGDRCWGWKCAAGQTMMFGGLCLDANAAKAYANVPACKSKEELCTWRTVGGDKIESCMRAAMAGCIE